MDQISQVGVSIIIPVLNGERTLDLLTKKILNLKNIFDLEIIFVNDGSIDKSDILLKKIQKDHPKLIKVISHTNNLGEHSAIFSGYKKASKKYAVTLACDLQNPPEEIIKLVNLAETSDLDVVYGKFNIKEHSSVRNLMSLWINYLARIILKMPKDLYLSSFKCVARRVYKNIIKRPNPLPLIDISLLKETDKIGMINVIHKKRMIGKSNYTLERYISLALRILYNITPTPLNNIILKFYLKYFPVLLH